MIYGVHPHPRPVDRPRPAVRCPGRSWATRSSPSAHPQSWLRALGLALATLLAAGLVSRSSTHFFHGGREQGVVPSTLHGHAGEYAANWVVVAGVAPFVEETDPTAASASPPARRFSALGPRSSASGRVRAGHGLRRRPARAGDLRLRARVAPQPGRQRLPRHARSLRVQQLCAGERVLALLAARTRLVVLFFRLLRLGLDLGLGEVLGRDRSRNRLNSSTMSSSLTSSPSNSIADSSITSSAA